MGLLGADSEAIMQLDKISKVRTTMKRNSWVFFSVEHASSIQIVIILTLNEMYYQSALHVKSQRTK